MFGSVQQRRRLGLAFVVWLTLLVAPGLAAAAINGQLKQLPLAQGGCLANGGAGGCKTVTGAMSAIGEPAMSSDGRFLYVPTRGDTLLVFERNVTTGVLTERACFRYLSVAGGCTSVNGSPLEDATGVALSPNGESLYVVGGAAGGAAADGIAIFKLVNGIPEYDTCFNSTGNLCSGTAPEMSNS